MYANGTYNNTTSNPHNPYDPPQTITAGLNTTDEMFLVYFHYLAYEEGDENVDLEALTTLSTGELISNENSQVSVYPNPAEQEMTFDLGIQTTLKASLYIYNAQGGLIDKVLDRAVVNPSDKITWEVSGIAPGAYYYSLILDGKPDSGVLVVK